MLPKRVKMDTRSQIIAAAREEFLRHGFDATRMRGIALRADLNKGLIHYYFKSKEALLVEVFIETFSKLFDGIKEVVNKEQPLYEMVSKVIDVYIDFMLDNPKLPAFIVQEMNRNPERHMEHMRKAAIRPPFDGLVLALEAGKISGSVRKELCTKHFIVNMISMMLFPFVAKHMLQFIHGMNEPAYKKFILERKKEIAYTLIASIKPH